MVELLSEEVTKPTQVLLVEDHRVFREWLGHMITRDKTFAVCGEADNVPLALELVREVHPDILIVDLTLRGSSGLDLIKQLKAEGSLIPALVLSMHDEALYAERSLRAGAAGFVCKHDASSSLLGAMRHVLRGGVYSHKRADAA
jgi:DNA-binding NarL/FixJ family response regulator